LISLSNPKFIKIYSRKTECQDEIPERSEDGLFVDGDEVTSDEGEDEVTVAVEVF